MSVNPVMKRIGLSGEDRAVIVHVDDVGMCLGSIEAFLELSDFGTVSSAALMAPCPWFPEAAARFAGRSGLDLGLHATLTSEWAGYRWGPLSTRDRDSGLLDEAGYFYRRCEEVQAAGKPEAARAEMGAQARAFRKAGLDPTHVDTHMGAVVHAKFIEAYIDLALELRVPAMLPRPDAAGFNFMMPDAAARALLLPRLAALEEGGMPLVDGIEMMPLDEPGDQLETARRILGGLPRGVTHLMLHASTDGPELRALAPDWESRVWNYRTLRSDAFKRLIESEGLALIGYRPLRDAMRRGAEA